MFRVYWFALHCGVRCLLRGQWKNGLKFLLYPVGYWRLIPNAILEREFATLAPRDVLDVGSPKLMSLRFASLGASVTATDLDDPALFHRWRAAAVAMGFRNYCAGFEDATGLPYPDASFDMVYSISVVEHIPDDAAAISEMLRVTRPHGRVIVEVPYRQHAEVLTRNTDTKGKLLEHPAFYERRYDAALLTENLAKCSRPSVVILGESLYCDPILSGEIHVPKAIRALLWPLEPMMALWNFGPGRRRPLSALLIYEK